MMKRFVLAPLVGALAQFRPRKLTNAGTRKPGALFDIVD
jgi:hypothetical protein